MKPVLRPLAVLIFAFGLASCSDEGTTASPSGNATAKFTAQLLPANEVPPIGNEEANRSATATITFNLTKDSAGNVSAATFDVDLTATGFPAGTSLTKAHIHPGAAGTNGGVFVNVGLTDGEVTFASGAGSFRKTGIALTADQANTILGNPASFYFNIHTARTPDGVARGQLTRVP